MVAIVRGVAKVFGFRMDLEGGKVAFTTTTVLGLCVEEDDVDVEE